ncbi:hypothetical protein F5X96DRAFT_639621, partial [Biscogniauxia mediterranea]
MYMCICMCICMCQALPATLRAVLFPLSSSFSFALLRSCVFRVPYVTTYRCLGRRALPSAKFSSDRVSCHSLGAGHWALGSGMLGGRIPNVGHL